LNICDKSILYSTVKLKVCLFGHWQNIRDCSTQIYITSEDFSQLTIIFFYSPQTPCIITITTMMSSIVEETSTKPDVPLLSFLLLFYLIDLQETPLKFQRKEPDICTPWTNITDLQLRSDVVTTTQRWNLHWDCKTHRNRPPWAETNHRETPPRTVASPPKVTSGKAVREPEVRWCGGLRLVAPPP